MAESEAFKRAKEAYAKAQLGSTAAGKVLKKGAETVGDAAYKAWESPVGKGVRTGVKVTADVADKAFEPVRKLKFIKTCLKLLMMGRLLLMVGS